MSGVASQASAGDKGWNVPGVINNEVTPVFCFTNGGAVVTMAPSAPGMATDSNEFVVSPRRVEYSEREERWGCTRLTSFGSPATRSLT